jgi:ADP-heptose:LPS heptosyltransferase
MDGNVDQPLTILVNRLSHIGDCILTLPMLHRIKQVQPNSRIVWAVESPTQQLLSLVPTIDRIVKIPRGWVGKPSQWKALRSEFRQADGRCEKIDIAFDPQGITKSAGLGWLSGAKKRVGIKGRWGRELSPWLNNRLVKTESSHIVDRSLELVNACFSDAASSDVVLDLPVCEVAQHSVDQWLQGTAETSDFQSSDFCLINPGASWASKRWEVDRFGEVAQQMKSRFGVSSVVVWAGKEEQMMAERVVEVSQGSATMAAPTTLRELAALAKRAKFFIGGDTGPMHIAAAVGTSCVGLYGTTRPEESGAYGPQHVHVQKWFQDGSCRERRSAANDAMRDILTGDVVEACELMLDRLQTQSAAA